MQKRHPASLPGVDKCMVALTRVSTSAARRALCLPSFVRSVGRWVGFSFSSSSVSPSVRDPSLARLSITVRSHTVTATSHTVTVRCNCCKKILTPSGVRTSPTWTCMDVRTRKLVEQMMKVQSMQSRP
jgi:hypothetical protein